MTPLTALEATARAASLHPLARDEHGRALYAVAWWGAGGVCVAYADDATVTGNAEAAAARDGRVVTVVRVTETEIMEVIA